MRGSVKANLIVFLIIAIIAFCLSSTFATLTIHENNESYKLIPLKNDSFEPEEINYVETYVPQNDTNTTNNTDIDMADDIKDTLDNWIETDDDTEEEDLEED